MDERAEALSELMRTGAPEVYRYAIRLTGGDRAYAEDLVQDACEAALAASQAQFETELSVGWMIVVARRRFIDGLRRQTRFEGTFESLVRRQASPEPDWASVSDSEALACLGRIRPEQRAALVFRYVDDLPVAEVAALMQRSLSATESLLARGRRELARQVEGVRCG